MFWVPVVVFSTFLAAGNNILDRYLMRGRAAPPHVCAASFGIVGAGVAMVGLPLIPPMPWTEALQAVFAGTLFIGAATLYYRLLQHEEISRVVPLLRLTSVQTLLLGTILLGERLTARQIQAFGIMFVSSLLLSLQLRGERWTIGSVLWRVLPITTLLALESVVMAGVLRRTSLWGGVIWENVGYVAGTLLLMPVWGRTNLRLREAAPPPIWRILILEQGVRFLTGLAPSWAASQGVPVALISVLSSLRLGWMWMLAVVLLGEKAGRREMVLRGVGILGMGVGAYRLM